MVSRDLHCQQTWRQHGRPGEVVNSPGRPYLLDGDTSGPALGRVAATDHAAITAGDGAVGIAVGATHGA